MAYIDRNKVKEHENLTDEIGNDLLQIDKEYTGGSKVWLDVEFFHKLTKYFCLSNHLVKCLKILLDKQPTADVVEVVRCKDCNNCEMIGDVCYCNHFNKNVDKDDYCSYGG